MERIGKALFILRSEGFTALVRKVRIKLLEYTGRRRLYLRVSLSDVEEADWTEESQATWRQKARGVPKVIGWVVPPVNAGSGGHLNIFRFVRFLEGRGYACRIYFYDPHKTQTPARAAQILRDHYTPMRATVEQDLATLRDCDAIFATEWTTAYPVHNAKVDAAKFYFCLLYTSPSPRDLSTSRMPSSA